MWSRPTGPGCTTRANPASGQSSARWSQLAHDNVAGNTADQILALATGIPQRRGQTAPPSTPARSRTLNTDPGGAPTDDTILRVITNLRTGNDASGPHKAFAPAGFHNGLRLQMTVGPDGLVRQISLTYQQQDTGSATTDGTYTWTVTYSQRQHTAHHAPRHLDADSAGDLVARDSLYCPCGG